jgi:hypothetical protein
MTIRLTGQNTVRNVILTNALNTEIKSRPAGAG